MPHWIAATSDSQFGYVTSEQSNDVSLIDLSRRQGAGQNSSGQIPRKIVIQPMIVQRTQHAMRSRRIVQPSLTPRPDPGG